MCAFPPPGRGLPGFDAYASFPGDYVCVPPARCNAGCPALMHLYRGDYVCVPPARE